MQRIVEYHIEGMSGRWASERVMDALESLKIESETLRLNSSYMAAFNRRAQWSNKALVGGAANKLRSLLRPESAARGAPPELIEKERYVRQTFPKLDLGRVKEDLKRLQHTTGRFSRIDVVQTGDDHVCVFESEA
jgi:hypothetical protein